MYNNIVKENRKEDLDILRVIAIIFVLSVHGLSYIGFYEHRFSGGVMFILSVVRTLFITCVPLFLIITGGIIELVYIVLQSVVKPGITGFFKIDLHIKCYIYLS